jgi:hypothetical protein
MVKPMTRFICNALTPCLAGQHHMDDPEPVPKRFIRVLKDRPDQHGKPITASHRAFAALPIHTYRHYTDAPVVAALARGGGGTSENNRPMDDAEGRHSDHRPGFLRSVFAFLGRRHFRVVQPKKLF